MDRQFNHWSDIKEERELADCLIYGKKDGKGHWCLPQMDDVQQMMKTLSHDKASRFKPSDPDDIYQDSMVVLTKHLNKTHGQLGYREEQGPPSCYLDAYLRIMVHQGGHEHIHGEFKAIKAKQAAGENPHSNDGYQERLMYLREKLSLAISRIWKDLDHRERTVFDLRLAGFTHGEIADMIGKKEENCRKIHSRVLQKIRDSLID